MRWKPDLILKTILIITGIDLLFVWLPFMRGWMDGSSYKWSLFGVSGYGTHGHYWVLPLIVMYGIILLVLGWRGAKRPFHAMIVLWHVPQSLGVIAEIVQHPGQYRFRGDTLKIDITLDWPVVFLYAIPSLLVIYWVIRDMLSKHKKSPASWNKINRLMLAAAIGCIPVQFAFLRFGGPHGSADQIGVVLTIFQWILLNLSLYPWHSETKASITKTTRPPV